MFWELLQQPFIQTALLAGVVCGVVAGAIGTFVVMRRMSFSVHAISELGFTGAAAALLAGVDAVYGLLGGSIVVALVLGLLTVRDRDRDAATGSMLAFGLGVGVLLLSLYQGFATEATNLLFGSIVGVSTDQLRLLAICGAIVLVTLAICFRPLLFASVDPQAAAARGVPVRMLSVLLLVLLAITVAEAVQVVGVMMILNLVVTPAAAAVRLTARPIVAVGLSIGIALVATVGGILLSLQWPHPVSFFVAAISFGVYLIARAVTSDRMRRWTSHEPPSPSPQADPVGTPAHH